MGKFHGEKNAAAAIFAYKDEETNDYLWHDILKDIAKDPIHVELITKRDEFLKNLQDWNNAQSLISEENVVIPTPFTPAFLVIHAHMGKQGIAPMSNDPSNDISRGPWDPYNVISWQEVTQCIPKPVSLVWLFGCKSDGAKQHWTGKSERLLTCTIDENFRELLPLFKCEANMSKIASFEGMLTKLQKEISSLAYFTHNGSNWVNSF